jgi:acetyltransferase
MFVKTLRLRDRTPITIRSIRPDDAEQLYEMHQRLSWNTIYSRYLRHYRPTLDDCTRLAELEASKGLALVATVDSPGETIIGVGHYIITEPGVSAEPALIVEDIYQSRGVGKALFRELCQQAQQNGLERFEAVVHGMNEAILGVLRNSGYPFEGRYAYGAREVNIYLDKVTA